jgi:aldehyde:ferredoxin oxidoreductase
MNYSTSKLQNGYANQILTVDVTGRTCAAPPLDPKVRDFFVGGRGLGLYLLHRAVSAGTKPTDPANPLIIANGPLGGIPQFPGTAKAMAISLSPLTGIPGVSNFGGYFGAFLKYAGFDALQVTGKADRDVMIVVNAFTHEVTIEEAPSDDEAFDMERHVEERFLAAGYQRRNLAFLTTGIGAANTTYGCINSHYFDVTKPAQDGSKGVWRTKQAGRTGLGSVMRDKKIRSIVVLADYPHGDNPYGAADWEKAKAAGRRLHTVVKEVDPHSLKMAKKGSAGLITFMNKDEYLALPVNNYQAGSDARAPQICGNLQCTKGGWVTLVSGNHMGRKVWVDGPEYETAAGFGSNIGVWNPEFIMEANWHCDNYGFDTISTCVIMAFIMECFQRGYLTSADTDGLELTWGNETASLAFIHRLAHGETEVARVAGKGMLELFDWVAARYQARTGIDARADLSLFAMQTKGLPFSLYRTHRSLSMQGSYAAASDIGAHHAAAWLIKSDLLGAFPTFEDKARALITYPRVRLGNDNMGLCKLPWVDVFNPESSGRPGDIFINPASQEIYADFYNAMLGTDLGWEAIFAQTDRDINLQRVMNVLRFGTETGRMDWIPDRAVGPTDDHLYETEHVENDRELCTELGLTMKELMSHSTAGKREMLMNHRKEQLRKLVAVYYEQRGWNANGVPKMATLKGLGLWDFLSAEARERITALNV